MNTLGKKILMTVVLLLGVSSGVHAAQATNTFLVSATILPSCVVSASPLGFGNYSPSGNSDIDNTSTIDVYCTSGTAYTLKLNVGTGGGNYTTRTLVSALSQTLNYNLYTTGARSTVWGDGTSGTGTVTGSGSGLLTSSQKTVYGRLFQGQDKPPSLYDSVVTVTVEY